MEMMVTLLIAGAVLLLLETVLPGMIAGIVGFGCLVGGVVVGYLEYGSPVGHYIAFGVLVGLVVGFALWVKYFPTSRYARMFISTSEIGTVGVAQPELLHQTGMTHTDLRPCGTALIGGCRVDVVTEGAFLEKGASVQVVAVEGLRVVVRACNSTVLPPNNENITSS